MEIERVKTNGYDTNFFTVTLSYNEMELLGKILSILISSTIDPIKKDKERFELVRNLSINITNMLDK